MVLGVQPAAGRLFTERDDRRGCGADGGVVLSYQFWQREFGGDRSIVGRTVTLGKIRTPVAGVTSASFYGLEVGRTFDVALPICAEAAWHGTNARLDSGTIWWLTVMGRRAPGISIDQAAARLRAKSAAIFAATLPAGYPAASVGPYLAMTLETVPAARGVSRLRALYSRPLVLLVGLTAIVLLVACANLAHLLLARASARRREVAIRLAIGASRWRVAQQVIAEGLALSAVGVAVGLALARAFSRVLVSLLTARDASAFLDLSMDWRVFVFASIVATLACVASASLPAVRSARMPPAGTLRSDRSTTTGREQAGGRRVLLASQIALSLVLLMGAVLFVRTLRNLSSLDAGFQRRGVVIADVNFSDLQLPADRAVSYRTQLLEQIRAIPGVGGAAEALFVPLGGGNWNNRMWMDGTDANDARVVMRNMIGTGYFRTLRTPVLAGRDFDQHDMTPPAAKVAIVNERFARQFGLGSRAVGQHVWIETTPQEPSASYEIVGLVANTKYHDLREDDQPVMYVPLWQAALRRPAGQFVIRARDQPQAIIAAVRTTLERIGTRRYSFRLYESVVEDSLLRERLMAAIAGPFGALAAILMALGLYGVCSYTVAQRTHEIGLRMALGADRRAVVLSIVRDAVGVLAAGLFAGAWLTVAVGRTARALLFGVKPYDPMSLTIAAAALICVAAIAAYVPARRAAGVDPMIALRHE
jgi:predicted permease